MAEIVVSLALETIRDLLLEEVRFLSGVSTQVKEVQLELQRMKCFLEDVDRRKHDEAIVRNYVKEIRHLAYRIEDVVESYAIQVPLERRRNFKDRLKRFSCIFREAGVAHKFGLQIEDIKQEISHLTAILDTYGIKAALARERSEVRAESKKWLRQTFAHDMEEDFVGMKGDLSQLVALLLDERRQHRIISIWGMGGIGKTTLARKIYHQGDIRRGFQAFAWVCITQECNPKDVLQDILRQLHSTTEKKAEFLSMGGRELVEVLYQVQKEKKCLVVVDDIWKEDDWESIRPAFPTAESNSRVLITTRKENIAKVGFPFSLKFLSKDEGWELLQKKAFSKRQLRGREIVQKCGYLPLAISVIGGVLSERDSLDAWEIVNKDMDLYLKRGKNNEGDGPIQQVLSLSYDDLPYHLKSCFLYLGQYPEDMEIDVEEVCLLWMAEGIVSFKDQGRHESLMDVAQRYFGELVSRSMVQVRVDLITMQFKSCYIHDLMRELCLEKIAEEEFFHIMDFRGGKHLKLTPPMYPVSVHRLGIYEYDSSSGEGIIQESTEKLRCLFFHTWHIDTTLSKEINDLGRLNLLRAVKFEKTNLCGTLVHEAFAKLVLLRFLGLKSCIMEELPSCVCKLSFLQTLDLRGSYSEPYTLEIPNVPWKLRRLKHLYLPGKYHIKGGGMLQLQDLDELEILSGFQSGESEMSSLNELNNLQCLINSTLSGNESLSQIIDNLEAKSLQMISMSVVDCCFNSGQGFTLLRKLMMTRNICELDVTGVTISEFPEYEFNFCLNLKILRMVYCTIEKDPMKTLEKLPQLRCLHLCQRSFLGKEMVCSEGGFPQLKELCLFDLPSWETWTLQQGTLPCLSTLSISRCPKLETVPYGLRFITSLQTLKFHRMPEDFLQGVRKGGVDFDKISNVNSVYIFDD
ncbi:OLC1v1008751C3 [Oldenlandia corymbosa var. corymbosa]|uniref:OLC1v1008751C3 n=1 Tax=Oldenlandia corymbosa var. corymbosa TaxID=529605 RepID=A0AAV1DPR3_OLDCO|nr:OLC1v1008751C3 [Oldenlandia corymbosa var. corymbosa]